MYFPNISQQFCWTETWTHRAYPGPLLPKLVLKQQKGSWLGPHILIVQIARSLGPNFQGVWASETKAKQLDILPQLQQLQCQDSLFVNQWYINSYANFMLFPKAQNSAALVLGLFSRFNDQTHHGLGTWCFLLLECILGEVREMREMPFLTPEKQQSGPPGCRRHVPLANSNVPGSRSTFSGQPAMVVKSWLLSLHFAVIFAKYLVGIFPKIN